MAINYPASLDGTAQFGQPAGTSLLASGPDHAALHDNLSSLGTVMENVFGTTPGTNLLRGISAASDQLLTSNSGGTALQTIQKGTYNNITVGSPAITGGTYNNGVFGTPSAMGGTWTSGVLGTPAVDVINARNSGTGVGFGNSMYPAEGTLTDSAGGTLTANAQAAQIYYSVMGTAAGNRTIATPTNISAYQQLTYAFKASGSANGTLVWGTIFRMSQDVGTPALGTGTSWNYYGWRYNLIDGRFDFVGQSKNII